jgi:hypothetical protein
MNACSHSTSLGLVYAAAPRRGTLFAHPCNAVRPPLTRGWPRATPRRPFAAALMSAAMLWSAQPALAQFTQDGPKLVGSGAIGTTDLQGASVALSADGNTAIVGGPFDDHNVGAAWVFIRSGGVWTQQAKLVGSGAVGPQATQSASVALSADGNTAIVGGSSDNNDAGAAWVFIRSGGL